MVRRRPRTTQAAKDRHRDEERRRRARIRANFAQLKAACNCPSNDRFTILQETVDLINQLNRQVADLTRRLAGGRRGPIIVPAPPPARGRGRSRAPAPAHGRGRSRAPAPARRRGSRGRGRGRSRSQAPAPAPAPGNLEDIERELAALNLPNSASLLNDDLMLDQYEPDFSVL